VSIWAWTSRPMTASYFISPCHPLGGSPLFLNVLSGFPWTLYISLKFPFKNKASSPSL
jgi:hypothetical protein